MEKTTLSPGKAVAFACLFLTTLSQAQVAKCHGEDEFIKIRVGFNSANGFHRQLLLGFMDDLATADFDPGYDAVQIDNQPSDLYFLLGDYRLVIQGVGYFDTGSIFPLEVKTATPGTIGFTLDDTENLATNIPVYIHDNHTNQYHNLRDGNLELFLPAGTVSNRFSLRFAIPLLLSTRQPVAGDGIVVRFANREHILNIRNNSPSNAINSVEVYDVQGQRLTSWIVKDQLQEQFPLTQVLSNGTYLIKVQSDNGEVAKKILVENE